MPRKSVVRLTDRPDMTVNVYRGCKTTMQQEQQFVFRFIFIVHFTLLSSTNFTVELKCLERATVKRYKNVAPNELYSSLMRT